MVTQAILLRKTLILALLGGLVATTCNVSGDVRLPSIFSDQMVLQRSDGARIWGWADPGERVGVKLGDVETATTSAEDGRWQVTLDLSAATPGPHTLEITGQNVVRIRDVVIGQVWLASGQSNMQFKLSGSLDAQEVLAAAKDPMLRHFVVDNHATLDPADDVGGSWQPADPRTAGNFSAVAYHFARILRETLNEPVGVIEASWGGTQVEAWTSPEALLAHPEFAGVVEDQIRIAREHPELLTAFQENYAEWMQKTGREDRRNAEPTDFSTGETDGWNTIELPLQRGREDEGKPGAVWFRRTIEIAPEDAGRHLILVLGDIRGFEEVYWNGKLISKTGLNEFIGQGQHRQSVVPAGAVQAGPGTLAIRVFSPGDPPAMLARVLKAGQSLLSGSWLLRTEFELPVELPEPAPEPPAAARSVQGVAGALFNGMIRPLAGYKLAGVIWYQGEGNASRAWQYRTAFPLLIEDWRKQWDEPELPFGYCQLAAHGAKILQPGDANWAELREAQSLALALPQTGQAVLIDLGEAANVHPIRKREAGERLAGWALAEVYEQDRIYSGPVFRKAEIQEDRIRIHFDHIGSGLVASPLPEKHDVNLPRGIQEPLVRNSPGSDLEGFAICGKEGRWVWADAKIEGDAVIVWSDEVPEPYAVRYAWADNPTANLYNAEGFPASPFRTDAFPLSTKARRFQ